MRYFDLRSLLPRPTDLPTDEPAEFFQVDVPPGFAVLPRIFTAVETPLPADLSAWTERLAAAGVDAARHTCPDLIGQLRAARTNPPDSIFCTLLDGDATLRLNAAIAAREPEALLAGLDFLDRLLKPKRSWVLLDETAPGNWTRRVRDAAKPQRRRVVTMRNDYPESDPSLLIFTLLKRRLRPGRLPTDVNVLLIDAMAAIVLGRFALTSAPHTTASVAIHHPEWTSTRFLDVPVGATLADVLTAIGLRPDDFVCRAGDLLRDRKVQPADARLSTGELTFQLSFPEMDTNPDPCIRCGWCTEGCPTRIHPAGLLEAAQRNNISLARHYGLDSCIECGICSYVCPSHLPILTGIRAIRNGS